MGQETGPGVLVDMDCLYGQEEQCPNLLISNHLFICNLIDTLKS